MNTLLNQDANENLTDLNKAWHGIHYLLTGESEGGAPPWGWIINGGNILSDDREGFEMGYGPVLFLTPEQVQRSPKP